MEMLYATILRVYDNSVSSTTFVVVSFQKIVDVPCVTRQGNRTLVLPDLCAHLVLSPKLLANAVNRISGKIFPAFPS